MALGEFGVDTFMNLDTRPAIQILSEAWDKSVVDTQLALSDKYGYAGFYEIQQELSSAGYEFYELKDAGGGGTYRGFINSNSYNGTLPAPEFSTSSNASQAVTVKPNVAYNTTVNSQTGKVDVTPVQAASGSTFENFKMFAGAVSQGICAAGWGIQLGKLIDSALYNANPDYWDSIGMSSLNPETWNSITAGDDSFAAKLFNVVFGLDPNTGKAQMFVDQNALAYLTAYMNSNGMFNPNVYNIDDATKTAIGYHNTYPLPLNATSTAVYGRGSAWYGQYYYQYSSSGSVGAIFQRYGDNNSQWFVLYASKNSFTVDLDYYVPTNPQYSSHLGTYNSSNRMINGKRVYYYSYNNATSSVDFMNRRGASGETDGSNEVFALAYILAYGDIESSVPGVSNLSGATVFDNTGTPTTATNADLQTILQQLQTQYPNLFNDAVTQTMVQPDGTEVTTTYLPVPMPEPSTYTQTEPQPSPTPTPSPQPDPQYYPNPMPYPSTDTGTGNITPPNIDTKPTTSDTPYNQTNTTTDLLTDPTSIIQIISSIIAPTIEDPPQTGDGDSPTPVVPTGSASALWSVYHPTQGQVDAFGGWLWTGNIITQIQQLLQNPMDGIITLHKVFVTPVDSGTANIVVGRLDSNISSATVSEQYVSVDCGEVNVEEQFGNVFDYDPYTSISLYLPFIGIVPLNIDDVMRSTLGVVYNVDLFTGACLAMVSVTRDGHTANMYQYSGVASVEYPLTGSVHSGLINGLLGIAGGVAGVAMASTGLGAVAGATAIAGGVANANKSSNARAGAFSGNAGAMGIKTPYLIIERPQTKVANSTPIMEGYPTNYTVQLKNCSNHVVCRVVHIYGLAATKQEISMIESLLKSGVEI